MTGDTIPIAGEYGHTIGGHLDPKWTRLKGSSSFADRDKEGLRLEMHGGKDDDGNKQKAIFEFLCPSKQKERRYLFNVTSADDEDGEKGKEKEGADKSGEETDDNNGGTIKLQSWDNVGDTKILSLEWVTEHACENAEDGGSSSSSGHWGFFTWFILM
jgi:hypothetical protein